MNGKQCGLSVPVLPALSAQASADDFVTRACVAGRGVPGSFEVGATVSVDHFVAGSERPVCAVDVEIACSGSDLRIQPVSFAPAVLAVIEAPDLPASIDGDGSYAKLARRSGAFEMS